MTAATTSSPGSATSRRATDSARELEDVAPTPGKGLVLEAFRDDTAGTLTIRAFTDEPLALTLVQRFITEAARDLALDT
jgi:hypothetical protein